MWEKAFSHTSFSNAPVASFSGSVKEEPIKLARVSIDVLPGRLGLIGGKNTSECAIKASATKLYGGALTKTDEGQALACPSELYTS